MHIWYIYGYRLNLVEEEKKKTRVDRMRDKEKTMDLAIIGNKNQEKAEKEKKKVERREREEKKKVERELAQVKEIIKKKDAVIIDLAEHLNFVTVENELWKDDAKAKAAPPELDTATSYIHLIAGQQTEDRESDGREHKACIPIEP